MFVKGKKILILGNGFDLAHDLPTGYRDFLVFCRQIDSIYMSHQKIEQIFRKQLDEWIVHEEIKDEIFNEFKKRKNNIGASKNLIIEEIHKCIADNIWYSYFNDLLRNNALNGVNWIDFEKEIRYVIQFLDENSEDLMMPLDEMCQKLILCSKNEKLKQLNYFGNLCKRMFENSEKKLKTLDIRKRCYEDLERLIRSLELYLSHFVEKLPIKKKYNYIETIKPDYVISFNYTNTYEKIYHDNAEVFYIHGMCKEDRCLEDNNMVLGIDEYWPEEECDNHTNYSVFKKFVQRIRKKTGTAHYGYLHEISTIYQQTGGICSGNVDTKKVFSDGTSIIYVFGHSLDITDKDILRGFFDNEATAVKVFCKDKETEGELIAKMIGLIGEKRLLEKTNQQPQRIEFINQEKL